MSSYPPDPSADALEISRRTFLRRSGAGIGTLALAALLERDGVAAPAAKPAARGVVNALHYPQRIKRVIHLYMAGGPSHLETFDPKPKLAEMHGQAMHAAITK